ncbi:galactokinase [Fervidicella metallireducens AeB]|uniref:Galactokinase n=1 Tax=Fervidicella metallireducens AeB TaxID=1403537 RepID=A0A017RW17_9CLOT|nr:galactokinase [Fervidicella metallireducens]EYE88882.1 galactokinase [Fervidicella metallireducens AeB]
MEISYLRDQFIKYYGGNASKIQCYFSPGRVNLIGEHIDYNGGYVFPCAISLGIYGVARKRNDNIIKLKSLLRNNEIIIDLNNDIEYLQCDSWGNYPKGVIKALLLNGYNLSGCDILFLSTLPDGTGLSSSASIEILTAYMLLHLNGIDNIDRIFLSKLCKDVENNFINVTCGIMDQFSVAMGKKGSAILLDCESLNYKHVPLNLCHHKIVIINSNKRRELSSSKYNERRSECNQILSLLKDKLSIKNLCEAEYDDICRYITDETLLKRARHVITENKRVLSAVKYLENDNLKKFGELMIESHISLSKDYEVTGFELDSLAEIAWKAEGSLGARMTGAGFGGCVIAIVENDRIDQFKDEVYNQYLGKTGLTPDFYICDVSDGVKQEG